MEDQAPVSLWLLVGEVTGLFVVIGLALFLAAGTVAWPAGWAFLLLFLGFTIALSLWLRRRDPGLLRERLTGVGKKQKAWDIVFFVLAELLFFGGLVLMGLDAVRFHWSHVPAWVQALGGALLVLSFYIFFLVFRENAYLSPVVRVQPERGQRVVQTGPYAYVRHPMYAGANLFFPATSLLLGSWLGLLAGLLLALAIAYRAVREERTLRAELPRYDEYMRRVRYRLIPGIW